MYFACSEENEKGLEQETSTSLKNKISFKGLTVVNRFHLNEKKLLTEDATHFNVLLEEEHNKYYKAKGVTHKFPVEQDMGKILETTNAVLPYFPYEENGGINETMIKNDFPSLSNKEIEENIDVIDDYYNSALNQTVAYSMFNGIPTPTDSDGNIPTTPNPPALPTHWVNRNIGNEDTVVCFDREVDTKWHDIRRPIVFFTAKRDTDKAHAEKYPNMSVDKTKKDAFKHIINNAFLCKYFWTVSSKQKRIAFARDAMNLWEECGNNGYATRQMDYHNNEIGRDIYDANAKYIKTGWITTGIDNPSNATLISKVYDQVENNSLFFDFENSGRNAEEKEENTYREIIKRKGSSKSIYLKR